jgi:chloramphenicol O-acetyltransferase type A
MFYPIDLANWPRREVFYYFSKMAPTGYSITVEVDVTKLRCVTKEKGIKFFPAYLWLVTRNLNRYTEFKCAMKDGEVGYYDTLTPLYAAWHEENHTFSFLWTQYCESFREFYQAYRLDQREYGRNPGVLAKPQLPPENAYTVSCIPWVEFQHFAVHSYENKPYFFPSVEAGKFRQEEGRTKMPLSLTCHHATTDGYHVSQFLQQLQQDMDHFADLILQDS